MKLSKTKLRLHLVTVGHVDHGKSTTFGHLSCLLGAIDEKTIRTLETEAERQGKASFKFAYVFDKGEERERGLTIDIAHLEFETRNHVFSLIDAPGHRDFVKNMITGASVADAAVLFVSAKTGEFEAGMAPLGQTVEHTWLCRTLGVDQIIIAINKMDVCNWSKERFEKIKVEITSLLNKAGYDVSKIPIVPISGWTGDNLVERSKNMPWYDGPTLYEALDSFEVPKKGFEETSPLRIPIQDVHDIRGVGLVPIGRVETGVLHVKDAVEVNPGRKEGWVRSIEIHHKSVDKARPGDGIGFNLRGVSKNAVKRGYVVSDSKNPATVVYPSGYFEAQIIVIWHPGSIGINYTPIVHAHTARVPCRVDELVKKLDGSTFQPVENHPKFLRTGDVAIVKFVPLKPLVIERYSELPRLGRFAIRDMGRTIGAGIVTDAISRVSKDSARTQ